MQDDEYDLPPPPEYPLETFARLANIDLTYRIVRHYEKHFGRKPTRKEYESDFRETLSLISFDPHGMDWNRNY
jgi:hypothetical protein